MQSIFWSLGCNFAPAGSELASTALLVVARCSNVHGVLQLVRWKMLGSRATESEAGSYSQQGQTFTARGTVVSNDVTPGGRRIIKFRLPNGKEIAGTCTSCPPGSELLTPETSAVLRLGPVKLPDDEYPLVNVEVVSCQ